MCIVLKAEEKEWGGLIRSKEKERKKERQKERKKLVKKERCIWFKRVNGSIHIVENQVTMYRCVL